MRYLNRTNKHKKQWNTDSGATIFSCTNDADIFETIDEMHPSLRAQVANGHTISPIFRGSVRLNMVDSHGSPYTVLLKNVYYHPQFADNLLSVTALWEQYRISTLSWIFTHCGLGWLAGGRFAKCDM